MACLSIWSNGGGKRLSCIFSPVGERGCRNHVPGWHALTEPHRKSGHLKVVGILQEQHPDRCALFMQWKQMDWPVWLDALNLLQLPAASLYLAGG